MISFILKHPQASYEMLGFIPHFLSDADPAPAREQLDRAYAHGGGWSAFKGFTLLANGQIRYPGDPPLRLLAEAKLRDEVIRVYEHEWVLVLQPNGTFEVSRMD